MDGATHTLKTHLSMFQTQDVGHPAYLRRTLVDLLNGIRHTGSVDVVEVFVKIEHGDGV